MLFAGFCATAGAQMSPIQASVDSATGTRGIVAGTAAPAASTPDPLGILIQKLDSPHPADAARLQPLPAGDPSIDLWERIRRGFAMPDLDNASTKRATRMYAGKPDYIGRMAARANLYLFHIVDEIERRGMPTELALLPFVESAMQPEALSHAQAAGLWQFIPSTGKIYQLQQTLWKDERRDVLESTRAALDYLQKLYADFGDWHLALAAYNCGEGCVAGAVARNRARKRSTGYTALRLPRETQFYVPKLQAIKNIVREPATHAIELPQIRNEPYFAVLRKTRDIDIATAAKLADMPMEEFRALNPSFNRPLILGAGDSNILLPADRAGVFVANLAAYEATGQALASWTAHTVQQGETIEAIAQRIGISEEQLREANQIPQRHRIASGSTILIPRDETMEGDISPDTVAAVFKLVPEQPERRRITYRVRRGDTLSGIAARYGVSHQQIVEWNGLRSTRVFAGQRLNLSVATAHSEGKARSRVARR